ncbi:MAG: T9SS type A sorting domain-containing protein [Bacteroidetes bacterium]|nr:T9SS type A sorting domain-containing protein [Bacteroidota bacterium]
MKTTKLAIFMVVSMLGISQGVIAQNTPQEGQTMPTFRDLFDQNFIYNPVVVPTGYLYNRVYGVSHLEAVQICDTVTTDQIYQSWWDMDNCRLVPGSDQFGIAKSTAQLCELRNELPVIGTDFFGAKIDTMGYLDGRIFLEDSIYHVTPGTLPYTTFNAGIAGISVHNLRSETDYKVFLSDDLFVSNTGSNIVSANLTLNNQQYHLVWGDTITFRFDETGMYNLDINLVLSDQNVICSKQVLKVSLGKMDQGSNCSDGEFLLVESDIPFKGMSEEHATTSIADAHIFWHTTLGNECKIMKPVIIVDGFDPMDVRNFNDIKDVVDYGGNDNLIRDLQDRGYDVIILNFPILGSEAIFHKSEVKQFKSDGTFDRFISLPGRDGGADYIQRNAFLTVKLIQMMNQKLQENGSDEQLVVVGPSMGGLITRYALAFMEKQQSLGEPNMNHNTRLWLSFDAPHNGANIPFNTQTFIDFAGYFTGDQSVVDKFEQRLRSFAARQMLIGSYDAFWSEKTFDSRAHHSSFYEELENNGLTNSEGWPQNVRKVSVLNGNLSGIEDFTASSKDISIKMTNNSADLAHFNLSYDPESGFLGNIVDVMYKEKKFLNFNSSMLEMSLLDDEFKIKQHIYGNGTVITTNLQVTHHNRFLKGDPDLIQGAHYPNVSEISDQIIEKLNNANKDNNTNYPIQKNAEGSDFTFIPSFSALGLLDPEVFWNKSVNGENFVCTNKTHFDNYYVPETNQYHLQVTTDNAAWILQEIDRGLPGCGKTCIEKDNWTPMICAGSQSTLQLKNLPTSNSCNYIWEPSEIFQIISGQGSSNLTIKAIASEGDQTIFPVHLTIASSCAADQTIDGEIEIPNTVLNISGEDHICDVDQEYTANTMTETWNFSWYFSDASGTYFSSPYSDLQTPSSISPDNSVVQFGGTRVGNYTLYAESNNMCGQVMTGSKNITIVPASECDQHKRIDFNEAADLVVRPNPASAWWTVYPTDFSNPIVSYQLINATGEVVGESMLTDGNTIIEIKASDLPHGVYVLRCVTQNGEIIFKRLIQQSIPQ